MKPKPIIARAQANLDIDEVIAYYRGESAQQAGQSPGKGLAHGPQPRHRISYAYELNAAPLWPDHYPYRVVYLGSRKWRLPEHSKRDIPS
ncbi:MAG: type II toxin-antitoxin system RelE/ParE family toxin [Comamonadaceae bacterium]|nr:type II toxin-antitoxin system RelE/ParE family toxin [Comamonadaceae bacterium]